MDVNKMLMDLLYVVVIGCVPIIISYVAQYLKAQRDKILENVHNEYAKNTIIEVTDMIQDVVDTVSQTYVDDLKKNEMFTAENQKIALEKAISQVEELLTEDAKKLIVEKYADLGKFINTVIESYIKVNKKSK